MKKLITRTILATLAASALLSSPEAHGARITLDGSGYYKFTSYAGFYSDVKQTGRYANLGADYYRATTISMQWITNRSTTTSGPLSFEYWGMPFYGAEAGIVLMTCHADRLRGGSYYYGKRWKGWSIFLDEYRFPELSIWELTRYNGWRFRDVLQFRRDNLL